MLLDILDQVVHLEHADRVLWYTPADSIAWFEAHAPRGIALRAQRGAGLGARLAAAVREHAAEGYQRIVLRGTDAPTLPSARVEAAFAALEQADLVLCPDLDGGYNLIALRAPRDALFELPLSTETVLDETRKRAEALGLRCIVLPSHHDVDVIEDLERIRLELDPALTPRTFAWFSRRKKA